MWWRHENVPYWSGKPCCSMAYVSVVNAGWHYLGQIIRISHFSLANLKTNAVAVYICSLELSIFLKNILTRKIEFFMAVEHLGLHFHAQGCWFPCSLEDLSQVWRHFSQESTSLNISSSQIGCHKGFVTNDKGPIFRNNLLFKYELVWLQSYLQNIITPLSSIKIPSMRGRKWGRVFPLGNCYCWQKPASVSHMWPSSKLCMLKQKREWEKLLYAGPGLLQYPSTNNLCLLSALARAHESRIIMTSRHWQNAFATETSMLWECLAHMILLFYSENAKT